MSSTQLKFLLSSSAENLIRLESVLKRRQEFGASPEFNAIIDGMLDWCGRYRENYLQHTPIISKVIADEEVSPVEEIALKTLLRNSINTFFVLHDLLLFLPREKIRKELHFFCQELFFPIYDPKDLSIILTSVYNAFEYSLDEAIRSLDVFMMKVPDPRKLPFGHVMELAIIDRDNPLSWAILAHEFGHYLDQKNNLSKPLADKFLQEKLKPEPNLPPDLRRIYRSLASEALADLTAYYLLGPVGILPLVNMELNFAMATDKPLPFDFKHPLTTTRLQVITNAAKDDQMTLGMFGAYTQALQDDEAAKEAKLPSDEKNVRSSIKKSTTEFADWIRNALLQEIEKFGLTRFSSVNLQTANDLKKTLLDGIPIGSIRQHTREEIAEALSRLTTTSPPSETQAAFAMLREERVRVAEVLSAGWIAASEKKTALLEEAFSKPDAEIFPHLENTLENQDELLMKSIEILSVMERTPSVTERS